MIALGSMVRLCQRRGRVGEETVHREKPHARRPVSRALGALSLLAVVHGFGADAAKADGLGGPGKGDRARAPIVAQDANRAAPSNAQDLTAGVAWLRNAAEAGNAAAAARLGELYAAGRGVAQDYAQAAAWLTKAAEAGNALAAARLGELYAKGLGVVSD
jgi:TPR repeat protein